MWELRNTLGLHSNANQEYISLKKIWYHLKSTSIELYLFAILLLDQTSLWQEVYMFYRDFYVKCEDPSFDDSMLLTPNHCYVTDELIFDMNGREDVKYLALSYALNTSTLSTRPTMMVHDAFNLPPNMHSWQKWKSNSRSCHRTSKQLPKTWNYANIVCAILPILG